MTIKKTVLIYDTCGEGPLQYLVLKGDHTDLDKVYINSSEVKKKLEDKLLKILFDDNGRFKVKMREKFPTKAVREGASVIVCGFLP